MITRPRFMTYEQWAKRNPDLAGQKIDCPECEGDGDIECNCCGHIDECRQCDGTGEIDEGPFLYQQAKEADIKRYKQWSISQGIAQ